MIRCTKCGQARPPADFRINPRKINGRDSWCRACNALRAKERQRVRRADPIERVRVLEEKRRYATSDKGRKRKREDSLIHNHIRKRNNKEKLWSISRWEACKQYWQRQCAYCGTTDVKLEQDHVVPLAVGPEAGLGTVPWNIVPACRSCNGSKGPRIVFDPAVEAYIRQVAPHILPFYDEETRT